MRGRYDSMKKQYDLLLVGATALSAGIVQAHPDLDIAVLEQTCSVAGEFANTYCIFLVFML